MFDVGFTEILLLAVIGLLVLGPERLPGVARTLGGFVRKARMSWVSLRNTIESELAEADLSAPIKKTSDELRQIGRELTETPASKPVKPASKTAAPDPSSIDASEPEPPKETDGGKSQNV